MYLVFFLYISAFFSLTLGEFGQFPFGKTDFSVSIVDILLTLGLSALLIWNIGIRKNLQVPKNFIYLVFFWAIGFLSLLFGLDLSGGYYLIRFMIYSSTLYLTFHLIKSRILGLSEFLSLVKITGVALAVIGILQLAFFPDLGMLEELGYDPHNGRIFSTFLDPNFFGTFLNFSFILLLFELLNKKAAGVSDYFKKNRWNLMILAILGTVIILTFSRSAYLMLWVSMAILLAFKNRKVLLSLVLVSIFLYFIFPAFNERINGAIEIDASASHRFASWDKGLEIFQQNPILGVGFNNIRNYSQQKNLTQLFSADGGNAGAGIDSSLIFVLATTGMIGFISYSLFFIKILSDLVGGLTSKIKTFYTLKFQPIKFKKRVFELPSLGKWYREGGGKNILLKDNFLTLPLLSLTSGLLINSFFINSLFFPQILFMWFSLVGVYYGLAEGEGEGS